ncbi:helix-turn-helix domain-containing protein [Rubinisphaera brasiliensis]|uniref:Uncharacterized protein n=1 Tax=Rubinisphaera brasiliensis (strain ATCC 49424 / DSM 5305 / JCM 21570 / IAM 15109 / NBRC 103401 / IFAM 1448) TaxID=756272 RepID=F0SKS0_RUBBR|nr:helix-turn-helix domain-containing protein [Rubinisphaera brasiliensis]ADY58740.1 hypothetical protein Plabr_1124 [Rubinisphaera brasiliensis DSM 5305]
MSVRVINGANEGFYPLAGKTIGEVRKALRDIFSISPRLLAMRNGNYCEDTTVLEDGDNLEFCLVSGMKGGVPDFWSESEILDFIGPSALDELKKMGCEEPYTKQQVSGLVISWSSKSGVVEAPNKLIVDFTTMTLRYGEQGPYKIDNSLKYRLLNRLSSRPGVYVHLDKLKRDVWNDEYVSDDVVNRQARYAREALEEIPLPTVTLDYKRHSWALLLD